MLYHHGRPTDRALTGHPGIRYALCRCSTRTLFGGNLGDFQELGLHELTLRGLTEMGFEESTPIQAQAIPLLMAGRDLVAQALTGTGKTAAFGVPIVERIDLKRKVPQVIVMTPTREL